MRPYYGFPFPPPSNEYPYPPTNYSFDPYWEVTVSPSRYPNPHHHSGPNDDQFFNPYQYPNHYANSGSNPNRNPYAYRNPRPRYVPHRNPRMRANPNPRPQYVPYPNPTVRANPNPSSTSGPRLVSLPVHLDSSDSESLQPQTQPPTLVVCPRFSAETAALKLQKVIRGFLARKDWRIVRKIESEVEAIREEIGRDEAVPVNEVKARIKIRIEEMLMNLLFRLGAVGGLRDYIKNVIRKVISLKELVDSIGADSIGARGDKVETDAIEVDKPDVSIDSVQLTNTEENTTVERVYSKEETPNDVTDSQAGTSDKENTVDHLPETSSQAGTSNKANNGTEMKGVALKLQKVIRGFLVRKNWRIVRKIESEAEAIGEEITRDEAVLAKEMKARIKIGEMLMNLLFQLDAVRSLRDYRRNVIRKVISLQELVDSIGARGDKVETDAIEVDKPDVSIDSVQLTNTEENKTVETVDSKEETPNDVTDSQAGTSDEEENTVDHLPKTSSQAGTGNKESNGTEMNGVREIMEKVVEERENMKNLMEELCKSSACQWRLMQGLVDRVQRLEREVARMERRDKKKRKRNSESPSRTSE